MKKGRFFVALIVAFLIFTVGALFAFAEFQELNLLNNNLHDSIPQDILVSRQNKYLQLIFSFLMLTIGGSLLFFSIIFRGIYFKDKRYDKISALVGLIVVFIINFIVEFSGVWTIFVGLTVIITFDCIFIFIKEEYDSLMAKRKANKTN